MCDLTVATEVMDLRLERVDHNLTATLTDRRTGTVYGPCPLLRLRLLNKMEQRVDLLPGFRVDLVERFGDAIHVIVSDPPRGVRVGLWLRAIGAELSVMLSPLEVYEERSELWRVAAVDLLDGLMRAGPTGSLLLPVGPGAMCQPAGKPAIEDSFLIYGQQSRWEILPLLPFAACCSGDPWDKDASGLMALAVRGAADATCRVRTDGQGNGHVSLGFSLRQGWHDPVDPQQREIRFAVLDAGSSPLQTVARRIREHVMRDLGKPTLEERRKQSPQLEYLLSAYTMKLFHGIEREGMSFRLFRPHLLDLPAQGSFLCTMTFAEAADALGRVRNAGIDKVLTQSVGFSPRGHDGIYPTRLPPDERLGGEGGFIDLLRRGRDLGYHMSIHDNYMDAYRHSPDWNEQAVIHDVHGEPLVTGWWGGGISHRHWPLALPEHRIDGEMRRMQALGVSGHHYLDAMGNPLEVNHHPRHRGPRDGHARGIVRILESAREIFGSVGTECGFLYSIIPADCVTMCGWGWNFNAQQRSQWGIFQLCDRQLPVWQMALHDLILLEGHGLRWTDVMRKLEFGLHPRTEWAVRSGLHPVLDDTLLRALVADFELVLKRFGYLQTLPLTDLFIRPNAITGIPEIRFTTSIVNLGLGPLLLIGTH
ncbi:MAG TPA: DUF5696 domain-containing protein, partial [Tepidisphaeraceae bacterium]|nr:DUF5696 domain-containing protein [Tepidisphaeraceae bacterium]